VRPGLAAPVALLGGLALAIAAVVVTILVRNPMPPPPSPVARSWDGKSTFRCGTNEKVKLEHVIADLPDGTAVEAAGSCELELSSVELTAAVGIDAGGHAQVKITGGHIRASRTAIDATLDARVTARDLVVESASTAIRAGFNSKVDLTGCAVLGANAVEASMNAVVTVEGAKVDGKTKASGNAKIVGLAP